MVGKGRAWEGGTQTARTSEVLRKFGPVCLKPVLIPFPPQSPLSLPPSYPAKSTQNPPLFQSHE